MKNKLFSVQFAFVTVTVFLAAVSRLLPHVPNFTPIAAMALFGAATFKNTRVAFVVPLIAMLVSDCLLEYFTGYGFHDTMFYVYASFVLTSVIGYVAVRKHVSSIPAILFASVTSSVLFFAVTNFGVWMSCGMPDGVAGLGATYLAGVPFFAPTALGDVFYCAVMFGAYNVVAARNATIQVGA